MKRLAVTSLCALLTAGITINAKEKKSNEDSQPAGPRTEYNYKHDNRPGAIATASGLVLTYTGKQVNTLQGHELAPYSDEIVDLAINPGLINYVAIGRKGDKKEAAVFKITAAEEIDKIKNKENKVKYSAPQCVAYSPDARRFYLASDTVMRIMDFRTLKQEGTMPLVHSPKRIHVSPNNYFLASVSDNVVVVYNLQDREVRKRWTFDSPVNDLAFSPDAQQLAISTADGMTSIYDTRTFIVRKTMEDNGLALSTCWNDDSKYMAVLTDPAHVKVVNMLDDADDPEVVDIPEEGASDVHFIADASGRPLLVFNHNNGIRACRMPRLLPNYGKLVSDRANEQLAEWMKMMPGESMQDYAARVNDETRLAKLREFEDMEATSLAGDMLSMASISLGLYDRDNNLLQVNFSNMPSVMLPVGEAELADIHNADDLSFGNARYAVLPTDKFMLIYAEVLNRNNGSTYTYSNIDRLPLNYAATDGNFVPIELIQQQQMEEMRLQELRQQIVAEAMRANVISDHTNITVDARLEPDFDANGNKIVNYLINFSYVVDPEFSVSEDFAPGKYHAEQSGAASAMLSLIKQAFEGDFAKHLEPGKRMAVRISGSADATPIIGRIVYDGAYGDFDQEPITSNGRLTSTTVMANDLVRQNEQLAFLRAAGVKHFIDSEVQNLRDMNPQYDYTIDVLEGKGSDLRRITAEFKIYDVFTKQ